MLTRGSTANLASKLSWDIISKINRAVTLARPGPIPIQNRGSSIMKSLVWEIYHHDPETKESRLIGRVVGDTKDFPWRKLLSRILYDPNILLLKI